MSLFSRYKAKMSCFFNKKLAFLRHFWNYMHDSSKTVGICQQHLIQKNYNILLLLCRTKQHIYLIVCSRDIAYLVTLPPVRQD